MTVSILRPTSTINNTGALTGGATAHAVLSDDSDASYVDLDFTEQAAVGLTDLTLPASAVIKRATVRIRGLSTLGSSLATSLDVTDDVNAVTVINWASPTTVTILTNDVSLTDAEVDGANLFFSTNGSNAIRLHEAYLDIIYVTIPTVVITSPTGTITDDDTPTVAWTPSFDSDGGAQTHFRAVYMANGQHPDTGTPVSDSGIVATNDAFWIPDDPIPNATYDIYVRVAQTVNGSLHWSAWDEQADVILNVPAPTVPSSITVTLDNPNGRIKIEAAEGAVGTAFTDYFQVQRSIDAGATWEDIRTSEGIDGIIPLITVVATGTFSDAADATSHAANLPAPLGGILENDLLIAVSGMDGNTSHSWPAGWTELVDANSVPVSRAAAYKRAEGGETGTITVNTSASEGGGILILCVRHAHLTTAPEANIGAASGASANPNPASANPAGWDIENTLWIPAAANDGNVALTAGVSGYGANLANARWANASGAGISIAYRRIIAASEDAGSFTLAASEDWLAHMIAVRPEHALPFEYDYEAPNGTPTRYRVRAVHQFASGSTSVSAWVTSGDVIFESTAWWFKHPYDGALNFPGRIRSQPSKNKPSRIGIHQPLGRSGVVAIRDTDEPWQGEIVVRLDTDEDRDSLHELLGDGVPILVQAPDASYNWNDRWLAVTGVNDERAVDTDIRPWSFTSIQWTEVDRPDGALV